MAAQGDPEHLGGDHPGPGRRVGGGGAVPCPKERVHPAAVRVLRERYGIDIADRRPRHLDTLADRRSDYVVTLRDRVGEVCPEFPGRPLRIHWSVPDGASPNPRRSPVGPSVRTGTRTGARTAAVAFYTTHLGFDLGMSAMPEDAAATGGRNRIPIIVDDLSAEIDRPAAEGLPFRSGEVPGPGGRQILLSDRAGNLVELFEPARRPASATA